MTTPLLWMSLILALTSFPTPTSSERRRSLLNENQEAAIDDQTIESDNETTESEPKTRTSLESDNETTESDTSGTSVESESKITKSTPQVQHTNCSYPDYFCNPSAADLIYKVEDQPVKSAQQCRKICIEDAACKFFSFFNFRGTPACYALKNCNERKPSCSVPSTCVSGQKDCQHHCPKLGLMNGEHSRWRCDGVNPYKEDIPEGTACYTSCPSWRNKDGFMITAKSTCQFDGSWSDSDPFPPGPLSFPPFLNKPDSVDMQCTCQPLNITYNPNEEKGTEFFCSPELSWSDLPAKIETSTQCNLLCDKMLVAITECKEGLWTGRPDLGFWCSKEMGPVGNWVE